jgi:hypothetical protein
MGLTLAAASAIDNRAVSAFAHGWDEVSTPANNWTEIHDVHYASSALGFHTQWRSDVFDTAASSSWGTSVMAGGMAFEIVAPLVPITNAPEKLRTVASPMRW